MALEQNWAGANLPTAFPGLSEAQFGTVAEDRLATAIVVKGSGTATVAFPLLDLGFDLYLRRVRTLRVHPLQVKARKAGARATALLVEGVADDQILRAARRRKADLIVIGTQFPGTGRAVPGWGRLASSRSPRLRRLSLCPASGLAAGAGAMGDADPGIHQAGEAARRRLRFQRLVGSTAARSCRRLFG